MDAHGNVPAGCETKLEAGDPTGRPHGAKIPSEPRLVSRRNARLEGPLEEKLSREEQDTD
jgi:hypothetical protein